MKREKQEPYRGFKFRVAEGIISITSLSDGVTFTDLVEFKTAVESEKTIARLFTAENKIAILKDCFPTQPSINNLIRVLEVVEPSNKDFTTWDISHAIVEVEAGSCCDLSKYLTAKHTDQDKG